MEKNGEGVMQTVSGLFDNYSDASVALRDLHEAGIANADLSVVTGDQSAAEPVKPSHLALDIANGTEGGAGAGLVLGGAGGLLAGLGLLAIPGIGPVLAGGWLLATVAGATAGTVIGGAAGGIIGAMVAGGVPEADAHVYSEGLRRGGTLVSARVADDQIDQVRSILDNNDTVDVKARRASFEREGWSGFDESAAPLTTTKGPMPDDTRSDRRPNLTAS
jgi:hypothetical protein